jgi:hypothetical protein
MSCYGDNKLQRTGAGGAIRRLLACGRCEVVVLTADDQTIAAHLP